MRETSDSPTRILFVETQEGNGDAVEFFLRGLSRNGFVVRTVREPEEAFSVGKEPWDVVVADLDSARGRKADLLERVRRSAPNVPVLDLGESARDMIVGGGTRLTEEYFPRKPVQTIALLRALGHVLHRKTVEREREALELRLAELERTDPLTGLWTRAYFEERFREAFAAWKRYRQPASLGLFEIYRFDHIPETYGYDAADQVVRRWGAVVREYKRDTDLAGAITPTRVAVLYLNTPADRSEIGAKRMMDAIGGTIFSSTSAANFTVELCGGLVQLDETHKEIPDVFRAVRESLKLALERGPGRLVSAAESA